MLTFFKNLSLLANKYGEDRVVVAIKQLIEQDLSSVTNKIAFSVYKFYGFCEPEKLLKHASKYDRSMTTPVDVFIFLCIQYDISSRELQSMGYSPARISTGNKRINGLNPKIAIDRTILQNIEFIKQEYHSKNQ